MPTAAVPVVRGDGGGATVGLPGGQATPHSADGEAVPPIPLSNMLAGAGAVAASVADLAAFATFVLNASAVPPHGGVTAAAAEAAAGRRNDTGDRGGREDAAATLRAALRLTTTPQTYTATGRAVRVFGPARRDRQCLGLGRHPPGRPPGTAGGALPRGPHPRLGLLPVSGRATGGVGGRARLHRLPRGGRPGRPPRAPRSGSGVGHLATAAAAACRRPRPRRPRRWSSRRRRCTAPPALTATAAPPRGCGWTGSRRCCGRGPPPAWASCGSTPPTVAACASPPARRAREWHFGRCPAGPVVGGAVVRQAGVPQPRWCRRVGAGGGSGWRARVEEWVVDALLRIAG